MNPRLPLWLIAAALSAPLAAQDKPARDDDIVVTARDQGADCISSGKDGERQLKLDCLTKSLSGEGKPGAQTKIDTATATGRQPPSRTGTFSYTATAQRMGTNFGKSARPQRPAPPVFAPPTRGPK